MNGISLPTRPLTYHRSPPPCCAPVFSRNTTGSSTRGRERKVSQRANRAIVQCTQTVCGTRERPMCALQLLLACLEIVANPRQTLRTAACEPCKIDDRLRSRRSTADGQDYLGRMSFSNDRTLGFSDSVKYRNRLLPAELKASRVGGIDIGFCPFQPSPASLTRPTDTVCAWMDVRTPVAHARLVAGPSTLHTSTEWQGHGRLSPGERVVRSWYSTRMSWAGCTANQWTGLHT